MLYCIVFRDRTSFNGGDYKNTKWQDIPNKPIRSFFYTLSSGDCLGINKKTIEKVNEIMCKAMGKFFWGNKKDFVQTEILSLTDEKIKKLNPIGWKIGK